MQMHTAHATKGSELPLEGGISIIIGKITKYAQAKILEVQRDILTGLLRGKVWEEIQKD